MREGSRIPALMDNQVEKLETKDEMPQYPAGPRKKSERWAGFGWDPEWENHPIHSSFWLGKPRSLRRLAVSGWD